MKPITWLNKLRKLIKELAQYQEIGQTQHILFLHACRLDLEKLYQDLKSEKNLSFEKDYYHVWLEVKEWIYQLDVHIGSPLEYDCVVKQKEDLLKRIKEFAKTLKEQ